MPGTHDDLDKKTSNVTDDMNAAVVTLSKITKPSDWIPEMSAKAHII